MSRPVYSTQFISAQGVGSHSATVTVPVGHVYVVKQLTFYSNPVLAPVRGFFRDLASGAALFAAASNAGVPGWFGFFGTLVFPEGSSFRWDVAATLTDGADLSAHGYDLTAA